MNRKFQFLLLTAFIGATTLPAFADHGSLATNARDGWIDSRVADLVAGGFVPMPSKPVSEMTNLEVAQLTAQASQYLMAQATVPSPLPGSTEAPAPSDVESLKKLVDEFKGELSNMDMDVAKLEDLIFEQGRRNEKFAALQMEYLKQTGTEVGGYSRS